MKEHSRLCVRAEGTRRIQDAVSVDVLRVLEVVRFPVPVGPQDRGRTAQRSDGVPLLVRCELAVQIVVPVQVLLVCREELHVHRKTSGSHPLPAEDQGEGLLVAQVRGMKDAHDTRECVSRTSREGAFDHHGPVRAA